MAMAHRRKRLGDAAEELAVRHLARAGCRVVARNARIRYAELAIAGELDLIVVDGTTLAFVEVKAGRAGTDVGPTAPVLAVGPQKQRRLRRLARAWLAMEAAPWHESLRFDVVGVTVDGGGRAVEVEWLRDAF
jgi:putative endonuclease